MRELGLVVREKRSVMVVWSNTVLRCLLRYIPRVAWRRAEVNDSMKSGIALDCGSRMLRPLALMLSWAMSSAWCGRVVVPMSLESKFVMMEFVAEVRGPSQSVQAGCGLSGSKWYRTLQPSRWGSF